MRLSKSQRREQNYIQSRRRIESRVRDRDVMSSSAERKGPSESRILSILHRLRNGWGMILLTVLLGIYLTDFYHHASYAEPPSYVPELLDEQQLKEPPSISSYHFVSPPADYQAALPGSVKSESRTFEAIKADKQSRDANTLPGAIGLAGSFDEHNGETLSGVEDNSTNPATAHTPASASTAGSNAVKEEETGSIADGAKPEASPSPSSRQSQSSDLVPTGEEKRPRIKKRKGKKRRKKSSPITTSSDSSKNSTGKSRRRKRRRRRKKKGNTPIKEAADSSAPQSGGSPTKSSQSKEESKRKGGVDGSVMPPEKESTSLNTTERAEQDSSETENTSPEFNGPRPMDRKMEELQVPGETGALDEEAVKSYYGKLVKAYLAPFANGISRGAFFKILRRKTYSLSPPGSNKGVQTILFQLIKKKLFLMDPYEVMKNSKPFYKTRVSELIWLLSEIAKGGNVPDTEFLVAIHDCVQTVNANHTYRGAVFMESNPTFTIVSCNFSDNIPIPMWEGDPVRGGLKSWDNKMEVYKNSDKTAWAEKKKQAVFRGGNRPSMFFKKRDVADQKCDDAGRSRLSFLGKTYPDLFDVSVSGKWCGTSHNIIPLSETDHHQYKYILYAEGNCFWADRLNKQVFGPSAIVKQETPCGQFWEPLLKPMTHYIPTDFFFQDTVEKIKWAKEHDTEVQQIVNNANEFASNFLSEKGIKLYVEVLLTEYTKLLSEKVIEPEKGSTAVTV